MKGDTFEMSFCCESRRRPDDLGVWIGTPYLASLMWLTYRRRCCLVREFQSTKFVLKTHGEVNHIMLDEMRFTVGRPRVIPKLG